MTKNAIAFKIEQFDSFFNKDICHQLMWYRLNHIVWIVEKCLSVIWTRADGSHYRPTIDRMVQSFFHKIDRKYLTTRSWLHVATFYFLFNLPNFGNEQSQTELEKRLNGIFADAPGFQKSTVISSNKTDEKFSADVLERIQILINNRFPKKK